MGETFANNDGYSQFVNTDNYLTMRDVAPRKLYIYLGGEKCLVIHYDGTIELPSDLEVDSAAKNFWNATQRVRGLPPLFEE